MEVAPFFVDFHHFLSIFTIYALLSRFTFCRDLRTFSANFFGQNSHLRNITRFLHVCAHPTSISGDVHSIYEQLPTGRILHCSSVPRTLILCSFWQWGLQPQSQHASSDDNPTDDDANAGFHLRTLLIPLLRPAWGEGRGTCHCPWLVSLVLLSPSPLHYT